jgi:two-component system response regulator PilR (NtrC family)
MQVKLLRAIQEKRVRKVGATQEEPVDVRIISATHQGLAGLVSSGRFRQDLFYRLNVIELKMPSLRECRDDVPLIAASIVERLGRQCGRADARLSPEALGELSRYGFPGNVRELENILERALALSVADEIVVADLNLDPLMEVEPGAAESLPNFLDSVERKAILEALTKTGFNRTAAAKLLGITFRALRYRMQRLGVREPGPGDRAV